MVRSSATLRCAEEVSLDGNPDINDLKNAFGQLPSGVVVITSKSPCGEFAGATVSSFSSLSFKPPLVVFGLARRSSTLSAILGHGHFAVHVVAEPQQNLAMRFATNSPSKFNDVPFKLSPYGVPLLTNFDTCLQCALDRSQVAGDHQLLIGRILHVSLAAQSSPPVAWFKQSFRICERAQAV